MSQQSAGPKVQLCAEGNSPKKQRPICARRDAPSASSTSLIYLQMIKPNEIWSGSAILLLVDSKSRVPIQTCFIIMLKHKTLLWFCTIQLAILTANCHPNLSSRENRSLIVLAAPSIWDANYADDFVPIAEFQVRLVRILNEYESAILIADRHTMPYLDGRAKLLREHLPSEQLLEANIYDINLHDFAPLGCLKRVKFVYRNPEWASIAAKQVDDSMNRFLLQNRIKLQKREPEIVLSGRDIVDNGINKALITNTTIALNMEKLPEWGLMLKLQNAFKKVTIVPSPPPFMGRKNLRLDDVLAFIDDGVLVMSALDPATKARIISELYKRERKEVMVVELPVGDEERREQLLDDPYLQDEGNCGLYTTLLATDNFLFVPVFGNIPANWKRGYSTRMDKLIVRLIETNTRKRVIPINIPREICRRDLSLRSLAWTVRGSAATQIREMARRGKEETRKL